MTKEDLNNWFILYKQFKNGYHMSDLDWETLIRLNHLLMEEVNEIHNKNMLD